MTQQQQYMYLEVVSVSMKSQCYEIPNQASVLLSTSTPGFNFAKQSKSIAHLDAATSKQWWMFKEVLQLPTALKEQKIHIKLYGSSTPPTDSTANTKKTQQQDAAKLKLPIGNTRRLEICIGKADVYLSALQGSTASTFELDPVSLVPHEDKEKTTNILKRSVISTITLRLLSDPPPLPPREAALDTVAVREKAEGDEDMHDEDTLLGTIRLVVWQGKNLNTDYPVFLDTRMNQKTVRRLVQCSEGCMSLICVFDEGGEELFVRSGSQCISLLPSFRFTALAFITVAVLFFFSGIALSQ